MDNIPAGQLSNSQVISSPKKVFNPIGTQSQWSFGWNGNTKDVFNRPTTSKSTTSSYHNQSSIIFGQPNNQWKKEETKATDFKKKKDTNTDKPVWNYNPKNAGKTTMVLGDDKPDYRKKDEFYKQRTPTALTGSRRK